MKRVALVTIISLLPFVVFGAEYKKVDIQFLGALIGPSKINGQSWDSTKAIPSGGMSTILEMIAPGSGIPASAIVSAVNSIAAQGTAAPDVIGYVLQKGPTTRELVNYAGIPLALSTQRNKTQDSYTPRFYAGYSGWPIFEGTKFQIQLWDMDLANHDQIAVVEIGKEEIDAAIREGKPKWVSVADQSMNQLLYVLISASESLKTTPPKMEGERWR